MKIIISLNCPGGKRENIEIDMDPSDTVNDLINEIRREHNTPYQHYFIQYNKKKLDPLAKIASLGLNPDSLLFMDYDAPATHQPIRRQMRIPRRTDIDTDMKEPPDLQERINGLKKLFSPDNVPDDETIKTALENSYWNADRAADYLLPAKEKTEDPLSAEDKENIIQLKNLGYSAEDAIQVYFACEKDMDNAKVLIQSLGD